MGKCSTARFLNKVRFADNGCWEWTASKNNAGYGKFFDGIKVVRAHRFSFDRFVRPLSPGEILLHICDNPGCVNPKHLRPGTQKENMRDMSSKRRASTPNLKLKASDYRWAVKARRRGMMVKEIAKRLGIHQSHASNISRGINHSDYAN